MNILTFNKNAIKRQQTKEQNIPKNSYIMYDNDEFKRGRKTNT